ncbi:hypothetical protein CK203_097976 [Vitis vinifera]|uniref:Retrotransposon gag domain-containing protein n=1 Tax=Vitis vinifera TaxID=29760 RepID=A0A438CXV8_VITVI|nr:hypothetical protein CK203_097976 [Vitis vinifera]
MCMNGSCVLSHDAPLHGCVMAFAASMITYMCKILKVGPHDVKLRNGVVEGNDNPVVIGASLCDHVADHLCSTWHPSIFVRTSITRSECLIWPIGFLSHFHKKSSPHAKSTLDGTSPCLRKRPATRCIIPPTIEKPSQHICDIVPDTIKTFIPPKIKASEGVSGQPVLTSFAGFQLAKLQHRRRLWEHETKMSTPLRSQSSSMGDEGYFDWHESVFFRPSPQPTTEESTKNSKQNKEATYPRNTKPPSGMHGEVPAIGCNAHNVRTTNARYGEATCSYGQEAYPGPSVAPVIPDWPPHPPLQQIEEDMIVRGPLGSISRRLDDMLSTPFSSSIINYEPSRGFIVPKFSAYDGSSDPFDHIMHYRQLMTLDKGNDALLCKVFPASLQGPALSWFHHLPKDSVDNF